MEEVRKVVLIEFTPKQIYDLIVGVEAYPEFLPWCDGIDVIEREPGRASVRIHVKYHGIRTSFATENENQPSSRISMKLKEGPFRRLDGEWRLTPLGDAACKVELSLIYEFSSRVMEAAAGPVFRSVADTMVEAFIRRAEQIYPPQGS